MEADTQTDSTARYDRDFLLGLYERMVLIREFEERVRFLFLEGIMPGTIHQCQGQEATAVGVCAALGPDDFITSTHRPHGHALAKGLTAEEIMIELFGGATGCCRGKGGSMHLGNMAKGMVPAIAIVGGSLPLAAGMALAFKMKKSGQVVACFLGDGASSEGAFHEAVNMAAIWNLPVVFACENNRYGASTPLARVTRLAHIADRAGGYGIRGEVVNGNDVLAVYESATHAVTECRDGRGPVLLDMETYRRCGHSRRDPCTYMDKQERELWMARDPIARFGDMLLGRSDIESADLERERADAERIVEQAVESGKQAPRPTTADLTTDVWA